MNIVIYDIETFQNCFTITFYEPVKDMYYQFVISSLRNDFDELGLYLGYLRDNNFYMVGFNNVNFDYPVLHEIIEQEIDDADIIYDIAQNIINMEYSSIPEWKMYIKQIDLYRIWHFDNKARSTSLKNLQISMNLDNVQDMPYSHKYVIKTIEEIDNVLSYNKWDVYSTFKFYLESLNKIKLRLDIITKFNLPCLNWNNGKIGEQLILKLYCEKTNKDPNVVKKLKTYNSKIDLKDCIPYNIKFNSKEFNNLLQMFSTKTITNTKDAIKYSVIYKNHKYDYGTGGVHGIYKSGVYESNDKYIIKSCDVSSLYPSLPIVYGFYIEHLGKEFLEVYRDNIVNVRLAEKAKPKNEQNKTIIDGYKEAANIPYGKSNEITSFLYNPLYSMKTTISGQLVLSMLCENLSDIPDSQMLMSNTDGCEILIPKIYENLYYDICKQWENETKLILEFADYQKMWIRDINNYGSLETNGKIKNKGCFEINKIIGSEPAYHKNNSFKVIPIALQEYFINNIPIETTINNHTNIYDFCGRVKAKAGMHYILHYVKDREYVKEKQQKNIRYYISNDGGRLLKYYNDGRTSDVHVRSKITIANKIEKNKEYNNINHSFYIKECYKVIDQIIPLQQKLF